MNPVERLIITRRLRVPIDAPADVTPDWGEVAARQLDAALLSVGFTCSPALLEKAGGAARRARAGAQPLRRAGGVGVCAAWRSSRR